LNPDVAFAAMPCIQCNSENGGEDGKNQV
jgi:hypothetical protein